MSLGVDASTGMRNDRVVDQALQYAYSKGVTVVAASGNDGFGRNVAYPSIYPTVISVGATEFFDRRASYSNYGEGLDILAPGGDTSGTSGGSRVSFLAFNVKSCILTRTCCSFKHTADYNGDGFADGVLQETVEGGGLSYSFFQGTSMVRLFIVSCTAIKATLATQI